jgi:Spy/CpxP family protein refolding chaperone
MTYHKPVLLVLLAAGLSVSLSAQSNSSPAPSGRVRQEPCWQQAGISQSAMQQRRTLMQNTRAQVESVCSDTSLSPQQKQEKVQQVRAEARQQLEGVITPQQMQAMRSCQEQRGRSEAQGAHGRGNPCGGISANPTPRNVSQ